LNEATGSGPKCVYCEGNSRTTAYRIICESGQLRGGCAYNPREFLDFTAGTVFKCFITFGHNVANQQLARRGRYESSCASERGTILTSSRRRLVGASAGMNIVLEGEHDVRYFRLADKLYRRTSGLRLLGDGLDVLAAGRPDGGTFAIMDHFHQIFKNAKYDCERRRTSIPTRTLLDDDYAVGSRTLLGRSTPVASLARRLPIAAPLSNRYSGLNN